ncbi:ran-binding protein 3-like isoform X1 [Astyanax mexicanus]|uniref:ran-binding protein 3-like isoform X1 n=1 Tax=Astyanax mexicanus TaxID=7994 RepID=UPI0020CAA4E6|nr:ran-binding protein 3-like isoform X1 [Astyanax mexicanus]
MRGTQPPAGSNAACPGMMALSTGFPESSPSGTVHGVSLSVDDPSGVRRGAYSTAEDKPVLVPPMFVFQKMTAPVKRRPEEEGNGAAVNKRVRSITYPSLHSRNRKGPYDSVRRVRSTSLSFPPPLPVSRSNVFMPSNLHNPNKISTSAGSSQSKVKRTMLRPSLLVAPGPWNGRNTPHLRQVRLNTDEEISRVTFDLPSSAGALEQRALPQTGRSLLESDSAIAGSIEFVFGENMSERVLKRPCSEDMSESDCSSTDSDSSSSEAAENRSVGSTLWESAAAYTAACRRRCLLKQVRVFTGEENESNVVQLTCKLFVLEKGTQSWSERGRGVLRLNDLETGAKGCLQSRMVMRHQGSLKLILNTKLYPHTHLRRPARRNLQVTATDLETHSMRVFLIQGSARDIARLYVAIHHRLVALRWSPGNLTGETREGHCSSEEDEDEDATTGDRNWRHSHSRFCP